MNNMVPMKSWLGVQGRLNWMPVYNVRYVFGSGKCSSSYWLFCITAIATKPMTVLGALAYFDFDFPLNVYT